MYGHQINEGFANSTNNGSNNLNNQAMRSKQIYIWFLFLLYPLLLLSCLKEASDELTGTNWVQVIMWEEGDYDTSTISFKEQYKVVITFTDAAFGHNEQWKGSYTYSHPNVVLTLNYYDDGVGNKSDDVLVAEGVISGNVLTIDDLGQFIKQ